MLTQKRAIFVPAWASYFIIIFYGLHGIYCNLIFNRVLVQSKILSDYYRWTDHYLLFPPTLVTPLHILITCGYVSKKMRRWFRYVFNVSIQTLRIHDIIIPGLNCDLFTEIILNSYVNIIFAVIFPIRRCQLALI